MGFYETAHALGHQVNAGMWGQFNKEDVRRSLRKEQLDEHDLQVLLSPAAGDCLEEMARQARSLTRSHFGHVMQLLHRCILQISA